MWVLLGLCAGGDTRARVSHPRTAEFRRDGSQASAPGADLALWRRCPRSGCRVSRLSVWPARARVRSRRSGGLGAVQGQDFPGAVTAIALRTAGRRRRDVEAALDAGELVRSWPMRGTLQVLAADDLHWLLDLLGTRAMAGQRGYHLLWYLARTGTLCLGPTDGAGEQLFVLLDGSVRTPHRLTGEEALGELARRFFLGHGPATAHDLARWAGIPVRDARAGLAAARSELAALEVDGVEHLLDPAAPDRPAACPDEAAGLFLLPGFDEFVLGYGDRRAVLDPDAANDIVPGNNGMFRPTVVHGGRIVGTWQWTGRGAAHVALSRRRSRLAGVRGGRPARSPPPPRSPASRPAVPGHGRRGS